MRKDFDAKIRFFFVVKNNINRIVENVTSFNAIYVVQDRDAEKSVCENFWPFANLHKKIIDVL